MVTQNIKPKRWYHKIIFFLLIAWILVFFWLMILRDKYIQIIVPGKSDITLTTAGNYTVFHEYEGIGSLYNTSVDLSGLQYTLYSKTTRQKTELSHNGNSSRYTRWMFYKGKAILTFAIEHPGTYEFSGQYVDGKDQRKIVLTIPYRARKIDYLIIFMILWLIAIMIGIIFNRMMSKKS